MAVVLGGIMLAQGVMGYMNSKSQYKQKLAMQQHKIKQQEENNLEARRAGNRKNEILDMNVYKAREAHRGALANIDANAVMAKAESAVAAAASGTAGLSVADSILNIERNAAKAEYNATQDLTEDLQGVYLQREQIESEVRARTQNDLFLPPQKPSPLNALINTGLSYAGKTYGKTWDMETVSGYFSEDSSSTAGVDDYYDRYRR